MTNPSITAPTAPIDLITLLSRLKSDIFSSMYCVQIGTIQAYDTLKNTAKVSVNFKRQFANGQVVDYPVLEDVPVFILAGGGASITMPIGQSATEKDQCLLVFCDRNIDNWWANGDNGVPNNARMHDIADAFALVGVRNLVTAKLTPANSVCIDAGSKKVAIKNAATDLKTLIAALIDAINLITVTCPPGGGASSVPINVASFTALKTQFASLLDEGLT